jgi:hypothetical protein
MMITTRSVIVMLASTQQKTASARLRCQIARNASTPVHTSPKRASARRRLSALCGFCSLDIAISVPRMGAIKPYHAALLLCLCLSATAVIAAVVFLVMRKK